MADTDKGPVPPVDDDSNETPTTVCADGNVEDPEQFIGGVITDPWDDENQTDWPQSEETSA